MKRRQCLGLIGVSCVSALAGCSSLRGISGSDVLSDEGDEPSDNGDAVPEGDTEEGDKTPAGPTDSSGEDSEGEDEPPEVTLDSNDPVSVVETFYEALYAPDVDTANELLHEESPVSKYTESAVAPFEDYSHEIEGATVAEETDGSAVVEFVLILVDSEGSERTNEMAIELRTSDGQWSVWEPRR